VRITNRKLLIFLLLIAVPAFGQSNPSDPLDPMYLPSIDEKVADYPANVWVTSSLAKVHQDSATPGNVKWALVYAARNEFESFQVHEQAGSSAINLSVTISDLVNARTGTHITSAGNIIVYREAYVNIVTLSDANGSPGYTPDILIPAVDPYRKQARNAFPFTIAAHQTQSIWFDIFVPPNALSGYYQGTVTITNAGTTYTTLPVVLAVWNFSLPSTATLKSMYGGETSCYGYYSGTGYTGCANYPGSGGNSDLGMTLSEIDVAVMLLDHRITASQNKYSSPTSGSSNVWTAWDSQWGPLINGTPANTSTILSGAAWNTVVYQDGSNGGVNNPNLQNWMTHFISHGWQSRLMAWTMDEPHGSTAYATVVANAAFYHGTTPPYPIMATAEIAEASNFNALSAIDIMVPTVDFMDPQGGSNQRSTYNTWLAGTGCAGCAPRQVWMYQGCTEHGSCSNGSPGSSSATWPSVMVDATPVRNRIMQWIEYLNNVSGDLYYDTELCWAASYCQDGAGHTGTDPWTSIYAFGGNGDGTLIYPGPTAKIGGTTPIPLPSMRLKNIRDGMEDYEYLHALTAAGQGSFAMAEAQSFITNAYTFNNDPTALLYVRTALGNKLHQLSLSTPPEPPQGVTIIKVQ
jgi:glycosyl hydrolase family 123